MQHFSYECNCGSKLLSHSHSCTHLVTITLCCVSVKIASPCVFDYSRTLEVPAPAVCGLQAHMDTLCNHHYIIIFEKLWQAS